MTEEYLQLLLARRPDDADIADLAAAWRKQRETIQAFTAQQSADQAAARAAGLTHDQIRQALGEYAAGEISFGRVVELIRTAAKTLAEGGHT